MIAIGLDPSITGFGWSVIHSGERRRLRACGVWRTAKGDGSETSRNEDNSKRIEFIATSLLELLEAQMKETTEEILVFVEGFAFVSGRAPAFIVAGQGRCRGIVDGVCAALRLPVTEVSPQSVKKIVPTDKRRKVEKIEVRAEVLKMYPNALELLPTGNVGLNASDAVAIAHIGLTRRTS